MYTDDLEPQAIDGVKYITFQPNTIVYAVPVNSDFGKTILRSKVGIVWHTTYTGNKLTGYESIVWCKHIKVK